MRGERRRWIIAGASRSVDPAAPGDYSARPMPQHIKPVAAIGAGWAQRVRLLSIRCDEKIAFVKK